MPQSPQAERLRPWSDLLERAAPDAARATPAAVAAAAGRDGLELLLMVVLVLNGTDLVLTMLWLTAGWATEANPLMATAAEWGWVPFAAVKLSLVSLGVYLLWRWRSRAWAAVGAGIVLVAYYAVMVQHAWGVGEWIAMLAVHSPGRAI